VQQEISEGVVVWKTEVEV